MSTAPKFPHQRTREHKETLPTGRDQIEVEERAWARGEPSPFPPLCSLTATSNQPALNPDLWQGKGDKHQQLRGMIHWQNMKTITDRPTPALKGCQAPAGIYFS